MTLLERKRLTILYERSSGRYAGTSFLLKVKVTDHRAEVASSLLTTFQMVFWENAPNVPVGAIYKVMHVLVDATFPRTIVLKPLQTMYEVIPMKSLEQVAVPPYITTGEPRYLSNTPNKPFDNTPKVFPKSDELFSSPNRCRDPFTPSLSTITTTATPSRPFSAIPTTTNPSQPPHALTTTANPSQPPHAITTTVNPLQPLSATSPTTNPLQPLNAITTTTTSLQPTTNAFQPTNIFSPVPTNSVPQPKINQERQNLSNPFLTNPLQSAAQQSFTASPLGINPFFLRSVAPFSPVSAAQPVTTQFSTPSSHFFANNPFQTQQSLTGTTPLFTNPFLVNTPQQVVHSNSTSLQPSLPNNVQPSITGVAPPSTTSFSENTPAEQPVQPVQPSLDAQSAAVTGIAVPSPISQPSPQPSPQSHNTTAQFPPPTDTQFSGGLAQLPGTPFGTNTAPSTPVQPLQHPLRTLPDAPEPSPTPTSQETASADTPSNNAASFAQKHCEAPEEEEDFNIDIGKEEM